MMQRMPTTTPAMREKARAMRDVNDLGSLLRTENIAYDRHVTRVKATSNTALAPDLVPDIRGHCPWQHMVIATLSAAALAFAVKHVFAVQLSMMA